MTTTVAVAGTCSGRCERTVEEALRGVPGVDDASADRATGRASVGGDTDPTALVSAVEGRGYATRT